MKSLMTGSFKLRLIERRNNMKNIIAFGLEPQEIESIIKKLPDDTNLTAVEDFTDIIAFSGFIYVINPWELENEELEILFDFYLDIIEESFETIVFIKKIKIPEELNKHFFSYHDFSELEEELEHVLSRADKRYLEE